MPDPPDYKRHSSHDHLPRISPSGEAVYMQSESFSFQISVYSVVKGVRSDWSRQKRLRSVAGGLAKQCAPTNTVPWHKYPRQPAAQGHARVCGPEAPRAGVGGAPGAGAAGAALEDLGAPRTGGGTAHLRVVEQPQLVEPLRGGHGLTRLWPCCAPPVAASSAPPAGCPGPGPWAGGRHSGAERRCSAGEVRGSGPCGAQPQQSTRPSSRPATARLPTLRGLWLRPPPPRLFQDCAKGGESGWRRSLR